VAGALKRQSWCGRCWRSVAAAARRAASAATTTSVGTCCASYPARYLPSSTPLCFCCAGVLALFCCVLWPQVTELCVHTEVCQASEEEEEVLHGAHAATLQTNRWNERRQQERQGAVNKPHFKRGQASFQGTSRRVRWLGKRPYLRFCYAAAAALEAPFISRISQDSRCPA
jgi:hypothetical protein